MFVRNIYYLAVKLYGMDISKALVDKRKSLGLRQNEAAERIGISQTYLSQIEGGSKQPSTGMIQDICKVYCVPVPVMYFKMLSINDVPKNKQKIFKELHPLINNLIDQIF